MRRLKKELGLFEAALVGLSVVIGAGIYVLIGKVGYLAGNGMWLSFLLAGIAALLTGLSYAELSSMFPKASSSFLYVKRAFKNNIIASAIGWSIIFEFMIAVPVVALGLAGYLNIFFPLNKIITALVVILLFSILVLVGIKKSAKVNDVLALLAVGGLLAIAIAGIFFGRVKINFFSFEWIGAIKGAVLAFFAFLGFEALAVESEETKNARKLIPKAIFLTIIISAILYVSVALGAMKAIGVGKLASSSSPLADAIGEIIPFSNLLLALIAIAACAGTVLIALLTTSRLLYGIAKLHFLPSPLSKLNKKFSTPHYAILISLVISSTFLLVGKIEEIAATTSFVALFVFSFVNASVIMLRRSRPNLRRGFIIPLNVKNIPISAVAAIIVNLLLICSLPIKIIVMGASIIVVGAIIIILQRAFVIKKVEIEVEKEFEKIIKEI